MKKKIVSTLIVLLLTFIAIPTTNILAEQNSRLDFTPGYGMTYNSNGGTGMLNPHFNVTPGNSYTVRGQADYKKEGHYFTGWNSESDGMGTDYAPGDVIVPTASITFYAQYEPYEKYNVSYNANGATAGSVPNSADIFAGTHHTVSDNEGDLTLEGHEFAGWNTAANGTGTSLVAGEAYPVLENTVLYAQWETKTAVAQITITFDHNSGNDVSTLVTVNAGEPYTLTSETSPANREGFEFVGWNTKVDGSGTSYSIGDTLQVSENTVLFAQWKSIEKEINVEEEVNVPTENISTENNTNNENSGAVLPNTGIEENAIAMGGTLILLGSALALRKKKA